MGNLLRFHRTWYDSAWKRREQAIFILRYRRKIIRYFRNIFHGWWGLSHIFLHWNSSFCQALICTITIKYKSLWLRLLTNLLSFNLKCTCIWLYYYIGASSFMAETFFYPWRCCCQSVLVCHFACPSISHFCLVRISRHMRILVRTYNERRISGKVNFLNCSKKTLRSLIGVDKILFPEYRLRLRLRLKFISAPTMNYRSKTN